MHRLDFHDAPAHLHVWRLAADRYAITSREKPDPLDPLVALDFRDGAMTESALVAVLADRAYPGGATTTEAAKFVEAVETLGAVEPTIPDVPTEPEPKPKRGAKKKG